MSNVLDTSSLCRVCSCTGMHDIHSPIPFYLHHKLNEYQFWTECIAVLMERVTGYEITKEDGLPQKICTICISYLQHAVNFRLQVIASMNCIRASLAIDPSKQSANGLDRLDRSYFLQYPINETNVNKETYDNLSAELDRFFCDNNDLDSNDSDDEQPSDLNVFNANRFTKTETTKTAIHNFFSYSEKTFEEDDLSELSGIEIKQPDDCKERKCQACKSRFMLLESYELHMKECVQARLISFITDCNKLLIIKRHNAISSAEFMRRTIFSLKSIVKALALSHSVVTKNQSVRNAKPAVVQNENTLSKNLLKNIFKPNDDQLPYSSEKTSSQLKSIAKSPSLDPTNIRKVISTSGRKNTGTLGLKTPYAVQCAACKIDFHDIDAFELHNQRSHNNSRGTSSSNSNRSFDIGLQLMNLKENNYAQEGIVDVLELRRRSPNIMNIVLNSKSSL